MSDTGSGKKGAAYPSYLALIETGEFDERLATLNRVLESCCLCPRRCGIDRTEDERGVCCVGRRAIVSSAQPHFGEERPLVGHSGSGTIFFAGCNLKCLFCQNYEISQMLAGAPVSAGELASLMIGLQERGCHNLNLVSPTHVVPQILEGLKAAVAGGFRLPIVYNTGGYDSIEVIRLLDSVVDIYMPDFKYLSPSMARAYSNAEDYPDVIREVTREMHRQVGDLEISPDGLAVRGLLIRHLVMPEALDDTDRIVTFIAEEISKDSYVNIMRQYHPAYRASTAPPLDRPTSRREWVAATKLAAAKGLHRLDEPL
jgi:putative pyruvate formate lyase activating enzyme